MAELAQMREAQAGERAFHRRVSRREPGEVAVGKREDRDAARSLTETARLDDVVERRGTGLNEMHGLPEQSLGDGVAIEALEPDDDEVPLSRRGVATGPVVVVADPPGA